MNLTELDRLEREATEGPWQRSRFVDNPRYRKMPEAWKESRREEEKAILRGLGTVGTAECNVVLAFRWGTEDADMNFIVAARNNLRPMLDLIEQMGKALEARKHFRATRKEYYDQKDLGKPPSKGWSKVGYLDVTRAESEADRLGRDALAAWEQAGGGSE